MKVFVDSENRIHDVGSTKDNTLTELTINDEANPFEGWSVAKICCYKVWVSAGNVIGFTPYVTSSLIEHIEQLGQQNKVLELRTDNTESAIDDLMTNVIPELLGLTE